MQIIQPIRIPPKKISSIWGTSCCMGLITASIRGISLIRTLIRLVWLLKRVGLEIIHTLGTQHTVQQDRLYRAFLEGGATAWTCRLLFAPTLSLSPALRISTAHQLTQDNSPSHVMLDMRVLRLRLRRHYAMQDSAAAKVRRLCVPRVPQASSPTPSASAPRVGSVKMDCT